MDTRRDRTAAPGDAAARVGAALDRAVADDQAVVGDQAIFAIERLPRGRGLHVAGAVLLVIGGLAAAGVLGNTGRQTDRASDTASGLGGAAANAAAVPDMATTPTASPREWTGVKTGDDRVVPSFKPLLLAVDAEASDGLLFVHGDVYTRAAMLVVVSIADGQHRTIDVRSVNMPGGSTALRTGPNDRFSLAIPVSPATAAPAWVWADAYDHNGAIIASARVQIGVPAT
jgi:hypothetical protein